jgi:Lrp/AsnC family transcriptional regulator, leucine-responsive regulatory protein
MNRELHDDLLLDRFDISLLAALQKDAQATHQELGELIHLSASQVSRRVQRLKAAGVIRRCVALLDAAALGLGVRAFTYVTLVRHGGDEGLAFEQAMADIPEVLDCFAVSGEADYVLQIVCADLSVMSDSVLRALMRIKGVSNIRSNIVLNCIKSSTELPLGHIGRAEGSKRRVRMSA